MPNFRIASAPGESGTTITLAGELDSATSAELIEAFERAAALPDARQVVLDLSGVTFIDSAGMRAIVVIERAARERQLPVRIVPPAAEITDLLQVSGVAERVTLAPSAGGAAPTAPFLERVELSLARDPSAPGRARAELREALRARVSDDALATATLLTSELVTNSVIHPPPGGESSVGLRIIAYPDRIRVEVTDAGSGFMVRNLSPRPDKAGGHGLFVVEGLSSRWGTGPAPHAGGEGFRVWFELDTADAPSAEASDRAAAG